MKNDNLTSMNDYFMSVNTLRAKFNDQQNLYLQSTVNADRLTKLAQIHNMVKQLLSSSPTPTKSASFSTMAPH
ncbi:MAG TPA: hypothetical protein VGC38_05965, partial [Pseudolabrys sp.]